MSGGFFVFDSVGQVSLPAFNALSSDVAGLEGRIGTGEGDITALEGRMTTAEGDITTIEGAATTLTGRVTTAEGNIVTLDGRTTTVEGDITTLDGRTTTVEGDITTLDGRTTTAEGEISTIKSDATTLAGRVTTAEGDITTLDGRTATAESNITALEGDVAGLSTLPSLSQVVNRPSIAALTFATEIENLSTYQVPVGTGFGNYWTVSDFPGTYPEAGARYLRNDGGLEVGPISTAINGLVRCFVVINADIYIGGDFVDIGGDTNLKYVARKLASGGWTQMGGGSGFNGSVYTMVHADGKIFAGGTFTNVDGDANKDYLVNYNIGLNTWGTAVTTAGSGPIYTLAHDATHLYVGGAFTAWNGITAYRLAKKNFSTGVWSVMAPSSLGADNDVRVLINDTDYVYAGGLFGAVNGVSAARVSRYTKADESWTAMGTGLSDTCFSLALQDNHLVAGGGWTSIPSQANCHRLARMNLSTRMWRKMDAGLDGIPYKLTPLCERYLLVAGAFTGKLMIYDSRENVLRPHAGPFFNGTVYDVQDVDGDFWVAGAFTTMPLTATTSAACTSMGILGSGYARITYNADKIWWARPKETLIFLPVPAAGVTANYEWAACRT